MFGRRTVYCNDIGCYTLGYGEPLHACDVVLCMGSSITQASGIARTTGRRTVAYIGDSTFFHSGLPALVNAVQAGDDVTIIVLDNYITAMTGFQPSVTTDGLGFPKRREPSERAGDGAGERLVIEEAVRGLGVQEVYSADPFDEKAALGALREAKKGTGVNVVVFHAPCVVFRRRMVGGADRKPYAIDQELCDACSACVRALGCPAIVVEGGGFSIDRDMCDGCGLCVRLCQHDAIRRVDVERV